MIRIIESSSTVTIGVVISCLCAFLFQIANANICCYVISLETVINGSNQIKSTKNNSNRRSKPARLKINSSPEYRHISFAICNECNWCASYIIAKGRPDGCPSCLGTKVRLIPIFNQLKAIAMYI